MAHVYQNSRCELCQFAYFLSDTDSLNFDGITLFVHAYQLLHVERSCRIKLILRARLSNITHDFDENSNHNYQCCLTNDFCVGIALHVFDQYMYFRFDHNLEVR
jgi:hypothetical protein